MSLTSIRPTTAATTPSPYSAQNNFRDDIVRVDHYFNDKVHFYARYMNDNMPVDNPEGLWAGSNYPGLVNTMVNSPGKNVVGNLTWTINPKVVNEARVRLVAGRILLAIKGGQFATSSSVNSALTNQWSPDPYGKVPAVSITGVTGFSRRLGSLEGAQPRPHLLR